MNIEHSIIIIKEQSYDFVMCPSFVAIKLAIELIHLSVCQHEIQLKHLNWTKPLKAAF